MITTINMMSHTLSHRSWVVGCGVEQYNRSSIRRVAASRATLRNHTITAVDMRKERIRKLFNNVELSVSSYDTAWVAMVPSPNSPNSPCFPECLSWLMENQLNDGSWGPLHHTSAFPLLKEFPLLKDALSSTLASIVALKKWNVGEQHIKKGLSFIESNLALATNNDEPSPIGFEIIFPHMLENAKDLDMNFHLEQKDLSSMLRERELVLRSIYHSNERASYLAYISEGLGNFYDRNTVMKYQMKNGSILNSPSATAAALIHQENVGCLDYLTSLMQKFGNAVPTIYPLDLYTRLYMVDQLERLGISRHFTVEIQTVLDEAYRCWMQRDEQIFMNAGTCALAFRVLRTNGYQISSDPLAEITKERSHMSPHEEPFEDIYAALEVYQASHVLYPRESAFGELKLLSDHFLQQKITTDSNMLSKYFHKQVDDDLKFPYYGDLERMSTRRNIQNYNAHDPRILKTTYSVSNFSNEDYIRLAEEDYNVCQSIFLREKEDLDRWVVEKKLDKIKSRQRMAYCYFSGASIMPSPELSDARITWGKGAFTVTIVDDFFDANGSLEELVNIIECVENIWNVNVDTDCCSDEVRIIFLAIKDLVSSIGERAFKWQARDVTDHVIERWLELLNSMLTERKWAITGVVPTMHDYIEAAYVSFTFGTFLLPALYFIGPKLSEDVVRSSEYQKLFELMSIHGRLINDIQTYKKELKDGKLNAVTLHKNYGKSGINEEEIINEIKIWLDNLEKELMELVLETKEYGVPKACKDIFWRMLCVDNFFYTKEDGFTGDNILHTLKQVFYEPVSMLK